MGNIFNAYAAKKPNGKLEKFTYEVGPLGDEDVEIDVIACGLCHSDLSMLNNEWGMTQWLCSAGGVILQNSLL